MVQMCIEDDRADMLTKPRCIINFRKLRDVPRFIIARIYEPQVRQELALAIPSLLRERPHNAFDTVFRFRFCRADVLHRGFGTGEDSLRSAAACRSCGCTRNTFFFDMITVVGRAANPPSAPRSLPC